MKKQQPRLPNKHHVIEPDVVPVAEERPANRVTPKDIWGICAKKAKRDGVDLEDLLWGVVKGLVIAGSKGNARCASLVFDRLIGPLDRGPLHATQVNVGVEASQKNEGTGPPRPPAEEMANRIKRLAELASATEIRIVSSEPEAETVDDLLA